MNNPSFHKFEDPALLTELQRTAILLTLTMVTMLYAMTVTIANVALPQMQGSLSATQDQIGPPPAVLPRASGQQSPPACTVIRWSHHRSSCRS